MNNKPLTRRAFVKLASATSAALVVGFNQHTRSWVTVAQAASPKWEQLPKLDGVLLLDDASVKAMSTDGGQYFHRVPAAVLRPRSVQDIVKIVQFANAHALKAAVRGQGHSQYGQTLVEGGIVIDSSTLNGVKLASSEVADAQGGATWNDVIRVTLEAGLTPPAMGNIGARVAAAAGPGEVLVSSTAKDLVAGSGLRFTDRGVHTLGGVPGEWHLFAADLPTASRVAK